MSASARAGKIVSAVAARLPDRARDRLHGWWHSVLVLLPTAARLPAVQVDLKHWVPCWVLRIVAVALAVGSAALVISSTFGWTLVVILALVILFRPAAPGVVVLAVLLGYSLVQGPDRPWGITGPVLLLTLHLCVTLCVLLGATGWAARVQLGVLARPAPRFLVIQLITQLLGVLGAILTGQQLSWPWVPVVAALLVGLIGYLWFPRLARHTEPPPRPVARNIDPAARRWGDE